jgi:hypothetical protein
VNDDLFVKKVPLVIKELIAREAAEHHRSVNQETIALLEEALVHRVEINHNRQRTAMAKLANYAAQVMAEPPLPNTKSLASADAAPTHPAVGVGPSLPTSTVIPAQTTP